MAVVLVTAALAAISSGASPAGAAATPQQCGTHGSTPVKCWVVDSFLDGHDAAAGDGRCATAAGACTLRAAIEEAVAGDQYSIDLDAGTYRLTEGQLVIPKANGRFTFITITGEGADKTRISGEDKFRVFDIGEGSNLWLRSLTVERGKNVASVVFPGHSHGAGVHNHGSTFLTNVAVVGNAADLPGHNSGGGLANAGTGLLTLENSTVTQNFANGIGGGIENGGELQLKGSTIALNMGRSGGAIAGGGAKLTIDHSLLAYNYANDGTAIIFRNCAAPLTQRDEVPFAYSFSTDESCALAAKGTGNRDQVAVQASTSHADERFVPAAGSAVIDAGAATCALTLDHLRMPRPIDGDGDGVARCDIGAFELQPVAVQSAFTLVDAATDRDVRRLNAAEVITRASLPASFNVRVDFPASVSGIASVVFELDGAVVKTENTRPWALAGDNAGDYLAATLADGSRKIVARAYSGAGGSGTLLAQERLSVVIKP